MPLCQLGYRPILVFLRFGRSRRTRTAGLFRVEEALSPTKLQTYIRRGRASLRHVIHVIAAFLDFHHQLDMNYAFPKRSARQIFASTRSASRRQLSLAASFYPLKWLRPARTFRSLSENGSQGAIRTRGLLHVKETLSPAELLDYIAYWLSRQGTILCFRYQKPACFHYKHGTLSRSEKMAYGVPV